MNNKQIFIDACENLGWKVNIFENGKEIFADFEQGTPAGEDFIFTASGKNYAALLSDALRFAANFNPEEHAAECYNMPGAPGLRDLLDDADYIRDKMLDPLYCVLDEIYLDEIYMEA